MAVIANLTPTPIPAVPAIGGMPAMRFHISVTVAGGAGTYTVNHGMSYKPTFVMGCAQLAEGTAPSATNSLFAHCAADDTATLLAFNVAGNGTYEIWYG